VACGDADSLDPGVEHPDLGEQSAAAEDEAEDSWGPAIPVTDVAVAEIELTNGSTLGFYEIAPGVLLVGQSEDYANGPQTDYDPADLENLTPTEFYQKLLPGEALPQTLIDAQARAIDLAARADEPGGIFDVRSQAPKPSDTQYEELNEFSPQIIAPGVGQVKQAAVDDSAYPWSEYKTKIQCQPLDWVDIRCPEPAARPGYPPFGGRKCRRQSRLLGPGAKAAGSRCTSARASERYAGDSLGSVRHAASMPSGSKAALAVPMTCSKAVVQTMMSPCSIRHRAAESATAGQKASGNASR
jgi:hypothetical protein